MTASILSLVFAFLLNAMGAVTIKLFALSKNPLLFIAAAGCFALNLVLYSVALTKLPLSVAYPVMVVASFILVNLFSFFYFKETIVPVQVAGYAMILVGLTLVIVFARTPHA